MSAMEELTSIVTGALCAIAYMVAGLGVTRAVAAMKSRPVSMFEMFFWPVVLAVIAATGDVA
jgi:hypothetical protein